MNLNEIERLDDNDAKIAFAKAPKAKRQAFPWLSMRIVIAVAVPAIAAIWILLGLLR